MAILGYLDLSFGDDTVRLSSGQQGSLGVRGLGGNDYLEGSFDQDTLYGNSERDTLIGNQANDVLLGGIGDDYLVGGENEDFLAGNLDNDQVDGGNGNDTLRGGQGNDLLAGGNGNDVVAGDFGTDTLLGGLDRDIFVLNVREGFNSIRNADIIVDFDFLGGDYIAANDRRSLFFDSGTDYSRLLGVGRSDVRDTLVRVDGSTGPIVGVIIDADDRQVTQAYAEGPQLLFDF